MSASMCFEHDAFRYGSDEDFADTMASFLREGLARGESAVAVTTREHIGWLKDALGADGGSVLFVENEEWYGHPGRVIAAWKDLLDENVERGVPYSRIVGEVPFGDGPDDWASWTRYESALNAAFRGAPAWIVCPYDERRVPEPVLEGAYRTHPAVWHSERRKSERYVEPAALLSEIAEPPPSVHGPPRLVSSMEEGLGEVRDRVRRAAESCLPSGRVEDLVLAVSEVAGNALRHGGRPTCLALWTEPGRVVCEVTDRGGRFDSPLAGYVPPGQDSTGGLGLWVTLQLCEALSVDAADGRTTVRIAVEG